MSEGDEVYELMKIMLNGRDRDLAGAMTIQNLLEQVGIQPEMTAVEVNLEVVKRTDYDKTMVKENDKVEIVTMMSGG